MSISKLLINHLSNPYGIHYKFNTFSFVSDEKGPFIASIRDGDEIISEKKIANKDKNAFTFDCELKPGTSYIYSVKSDKSSFEIPFMTAFILDANFIKSSDKNVFAPIFHKRLKIDKDVKSAILTITGVGLYRAFINGNRVGDAYLTPGFNDYDAYLRYQSYDVTSYFKSQFVSLDVHMGDGWYKGRIGIDKSIESGDKVFGDEYKLCALINIFYSDGTGEKVKTDETWTYSSSSCKMNNIYDGETRDYSLDTSKENSVKICESKYNLVPDFGTQIKEKNILKPSLYISPKGEKILDFGQNMAGFVRYHGKLACGQKLVIQHGEILQDDCFYNDNLRTAKATATYIGDGKERIYEPYFTYFGFRYAKVEGLSELEPSDFDGVVIYSDLVSTLQCKTDSEKINKLMSNTLWGQKSNFIDVPTDCPQRDERLGWTADTQVFVNTACYQMDTYNFYRKYLHDLRYDQTMYYDGDIPMYSPSLKHEAGSGGAVWADAGTIIPWNLYLNYGDKQFLTYCYDVMRDYTETLINKDISEGNRGLISRGFTFGDWLAQDGVCSQSLTGGTDNAYIMCVYYYNSLKLTANAAKELGKQEDYERYSELMKKVYDAILDEYFSPNGKLALNTQTSYVLSLYYGIYRDKERVIKDFKERLKKDFYKMKTGFTGTPLILLAMFDNGMDDDAYRILYNEECPGWLYAVNMGATTIWERWNSVLPNGKISGTNMNSLNHYSYGSVCEAIYSRIVGLRNNSIGWRSVLIEPHLNYRMKSASIEYESVMGLYKLSWSLNGEKLHVETSIPYGCSALVRLPNKSEFTIEHGDYTFDTIVDKTITHPFNLDTPNLDILNNKEARKLMETILPRAYSMVTGENEEFKISDGRFMSYLAMFGTTNESIKEYEEKLKEITP